MEGEYQQCISTDGALIRDWVLIEVAGSRKIATTHERSVLHSLLTQAVYYGHKEAVRQVSERLRQLAEDTSSSKYNIVKGASHLDFIGLTFGGAEIPRECERLIRTHSPLMLALEMDRTDVAEQLLDLGASVSFRKQDGLTALHIACRRGLVDMLGVIITAGRSQQWLLMPYPEQVDEEKFNSADRIIINFKEKLTGTTPLMHAVEGGDLETVKELMKYKFLKIDDVDNVGNTVLHIAYMRSKHEIVKFVSDVAKERGLELEKLCNKDGNTPNEVEVNDSVLIIPPEILKLDKSAIQIYLDALSEGKAKIPVCGLIITGKERSGKTSLYRQMVGKKFDPDLVSTRGINNEEIDALIDSRNVEAALNWQEKDSDHYVDALQDNLYEAGLMKSSELEAVSEASILDQLAMNIKISSSEIESPDVPQPMPKPTSLDASASINVSPFLHHENSIHDKLTINSEISQPIQEEVNEFIFSDTEEMEQASFDITIEQVAKISESLKYGQPKKKKLILNVKDLAGQREYWPMHQCFLLRRALFLVVFKIPDMLTFVNNPHTAAYNPLEDICYWLRSIHAHVTAGSGKEGDKSLKQVLLVGTHLGHPPHSPKDLQKIDRFLEDKVIRPKSYANQIHSLGGTNTTCYFIPVENSIDIHKRPESYLQDSGTKLVQDKIKELSESMPFLKEDHPIKWIKFEERISEAGKNSPVMTVEEVKRLAVQSAITSPVQQDLALKFFHLSGKIICLSNLESHFFSADDIKKMKDLIVLSPHWLMSVMKVTVELPTDKRIEGLDMSKDQVQRLKNEGVVEYKILQECWTESILSTKMSYREGISHIKLILQAYQLISPLDSPERDNEYLISIIKQEECEVTSPLTLEDQLSGVSFKKPSKHIISARQDTEDAELHTTSPLLLEDPTFSGVIFTELPKHFTITSAGKDINLEEDAGIHLRIPEDSLTQSEEVDMTIATSFAGPFRLPDGVQAVSPIHFVKLSNQVKFKKDIELYIQHNAFIAKDSTGLVFLKTTSTISGNSPNYIFEIVETMHLEALPDRPNWVLVKVRSFSGFGVGDKGQHEKLYSARLYNTVVSKQAEAVFCLCQQLENYLKHCDEIMKKYPMQSVYKGVIITSDEIKLDCSESAAYDVTADKNFITRHEVDVATEASSQSFFLMAFNYLKSWITGPKEVHVPYDYPPRIRITFRLKSELELFGTKKVTITVEGLNKQYQFHLCEDITSLANTVSNNQPDCTTISLTSGNEVVQTQDASSTPQQYRLETECREFTTPGIPSDLNTTFFTSENLSLDGKPKLHQLNCLKFEDQQQLKIINCVGSDLVKLGLALEFDYETIKTIEKNNHFKVHESCCDLLHRWLKGEACQPITWARLIEALRDTDKAQLAIQLESILTW